MKNLAALWLEFGAPTDHSLKQDIEDHSYPGQEKIAQYLEGGKVKLMSAGTGKDLFTGETIAANYYIATDGEYSWPSTLSYYVRSYNLRLPKEFEQKILESPGI